MRGRNRKRRQKMLTFQAEIDAFKKALPKLLADHHEGEFAVLKSSNVERVLPTYEQAMNWAYEQYGLHEEFFVKQVLEIPQVTHFHRLR
jgi:hypothetical protein